METAIITGSSKGIGLETALAFGRAYVDWNAATDEEWYAAVERTFGLNARQH